MSPGKNEFGTPSRCVILPDDSSCLKTSKLPPPRGSNIVRLFQDQAGQTPNDFAVVSGGLRLTYRDLDAQSNRLAHYLKSAGVGTETLVGLAVPRSHQMLIATLAVIKAGGADVP